MNLVDGKKIATAILAHIKAQVSLLLTAPTLTVIACNPNFETEKYLALKKHTAESLGIILNVLILPKDSNTNQLIDLIRKAVQETDGVVVQLPLPAYIDTDAVLEAVPASHDVDAFSYQKKPSLVLPPVIGAINEISELYKVQWKDKKVAIFGSGRLVGTPAEYYANSQGAIVEVVTAETKDITSITKRSDIIILGVGKPNLLLPEMIKDGVIVFDAGASEDGGLLVGDAHPDVATKASLITPVPGGIGPITIALLFRNLIKLQLAKIEKVEI